MTCDVFDRKYQVMNFNTGRVHQLSPLNMVLRIVLKTFEIPFPIASAQINNSRENPHSTVVLHSSSASH